jgi:chromosomal replication initiator protein
MEATFERFVVGASNAEAYRHARAVAGGEFQGPSPLVLYGGVGLGKTHLANAIATAMCQAHIPCSVACHAGAEFVERLLAAMRGEQPDAFWAEVTQPAVLILDDIHFLAGHAETQEVLVRLFALLHEQGTPVVLTSDRAPQDISDVEQRLRHHFEGGVLACIKPPELDLRHRILRQKAADRGICLPDDVAAFIAESVVGSGRTLEGVLTRVHAYAAGRRKQADAHVQLTRALAQEALRAFEVPRAAITPELVRATVSQARGLPPRALTSQRRTREITIARQLAMYLCRKYCGLPLSEIAQRFGRRDHSTVLHACETVEAKRAADPAFNTEVQQLEDLIIRPGVYSGKASRR